MRPASFLFYPYILAGTEFSYNLGMLITSQPINSSYVWGVSCCAGPPVIALCVLLRAFIVGGWMHVCLDCGPPCSGMLACSMPVSPVSCGLNRNGPLGPGA